MDYLYDYIIFTLPINLVEILAAIAGTIFLRKVPASDLATKYFVWFLWLTVVLETIGCYAPLGHFEGYNFFSFLKDTPFQNNKWLYNFYSLVSAVFFTLYFRQFIKSRIQRLILKILIVFFIVSSVVNLAVTGVLFTEDSKYVNLLGTFLIFFSITLFYFELLRSDFC